MSLKLVPYLLVALAIAVIAYGTWQHQKYPPQVIATGTFYR